MTSPEKKPSKSRISPSPEEDKLDLILRQLMQMKESNKERDTRLQQLENGAGNGPQINTNAGGGPGLSGGTPMSTISGGGKECKITLTFGEDTSPKALKLFVDHYELVREQNLARNVVTWSDAAFRSRELRLQLREEPALWLAQEHAMLSPWMSNDNEIIRRLKERYSGSQSIELNIIAFEEMSQRDNESLAQYMTRCQEAGYQAYGAFDAASRQQRIVWRFLSGIRDADVRNAVIKEKWMASDREAKPAAEVLKIAETAKLTKIATTATQAKGRDYVRKEASVNVVRDNTKKDAPVKDGARKDGVVNSVADKRRGYNQKKSAGNSSNNYECHYCGTTNHYGGWRLCEKRLKENPKWKPGDQVDLSGSKDF